MSIETLKAAMLAQMADTNKWQRQFLNQLFHLWLGIRVRMNFLNMVNKMKTLFLDRDGVINKRMPPGQYVNSCREFEFIEGSIQAIVDLGRFFTKIIVVTNQQGVGKNRMTEQCLKAIHAKMQDCLREKGRPVDAIYYCPHLERMQCNCRKPQPGMALQAKRDFPEIDFQRSVMVGDSPSDLAFGRNLGMKTVLTGDKILQGEMPDFQFNSLLEFSNHLQKYPATLLAHVGFE